MTTSIGNTEASNSLQSSLMMPLAQLKKGSKLESIANSALQWSAGFWFLIMLIGQFIFVYYVVAFYGGAVLQGDLEIWNQVLPHGYEKGETIGNLAVGVHMTFAAIIMLGGALQLVPQIRARFPVFHRWNGRIYLLTACICALTGLMMKFREPEGLLNINSIGITINAMLILLFAVIAVRFAMSGQIVRHRRWALRLFLTVSGVWFFRVGLMLWIFLNGGPVGIDTETFTGPTIVSLSFIQYLFPLAVLQLYFLTQMHAKAAGKLSMAVTLFGLTIAMGIGITIAFMGLWLPRL